MIKIQIDEYENLLHETRVLHRESRELIQEYVRELEELLAPDGGFQTNLVSEKAKLILGKFKERVIPELEAEFEETEQQIYILGQRLAEGDEDRRLHVQWERV